jgi:hypothetical protein
MTEVDQIRKRMNRVTIEITILYARLQGNPDEFTANEASFLKHRCLLIQDEFKEIIESCTKVEELECKSK